LILTFRGQKRFEIELREMEVPPAPPAPPPVAPTTKGNTRRILRYGNRHHYKAKEAPPVGASKRATLECRWVVFVETRGGWPAGEPAGTVERVTFNVDGVLHHRVQAPYELKW
jgi:hypothetical protein